MIRLVSEAGTGAEGVNLKDTQPMPIHDRLRHRLQWHVEFAETMPAAVSWAERRLFGIVDAVLNGAEGL